MNLINRLIYAIDNFPIIEDDPRDLFKDSVKELDKLQDRKKVLELKVIEMQDTNILLRRELSLQLKNSSRLNEILVGINNDQNNK